MIYILIQTGQSFYENIYGPIKQNLPHEMDY